MPAAGSSRKTIYAALAGNLLVALTKFIAAAWTGSSAMLSEGVHSLVDSGNQALLLYGLWRAGRPPDRTHPLGHGREIYFWSFMVAVLLFALGAGVSLYEGVLHISEPEPMTDPIVNYVVLALAFLFESASWRVAFREFRKTKGEAGWFEALVRSKDPPTFIVLLEDTAALIGLSIAFVGTLAAQIWGAAWLDGAASIGIGLLLALVAVFLARESKGLLIGEPAAPSVSASLRAIAVGEPGVKGVNGGFTVHLAPDQIVAALSLDFDDDASASTIERAFAEIERRSHAAHPHLIGLFIRPEGRESFAARLNRVRWTSPSTAGPEDEGPADPAARRPED